MKRVFLAVEQPPLPEEAEVADAAGWKLKTFAAPKALRGKEVGPLIEDNRHICRKTVPAVEVVPAGNVENADALEGAPVIGKGAINSRPEIVGVGTGEAPPGRQLKLTSTRAKTWHGATRARSALGQCSRSLSEESKNGSQDHQDERHPETH